MKKILIIEDDPILTNIYRHKYQAAGYEVASAADGEAGLQKVRDFGPDLIQLDLMLPKMNGVEVIRRIRFQPGLKDLPIVVFSNSYAPEMIAEARKAGATTCISKSNCSPRLVLDTVHELLSIPPAVPVRAVRPEPRAVRAPANPLPFTPKDSPATPERAPLTGNGNGSHADVREEFLSSTPRMQADLRAQLSLFIKSRDEKEQLSHLCRMARLVHSIAGYAGMTGFPRISQIANVLEVLLKELETKPKQITPSTFRTVSNAVDCLGLLFQAGTSHQDEASKTPLILAVDDEPISRITLRTALDKANLRAITLDDPVLALRVLSQNRFDLIFLDVDMPGMDGFEVCKRIRASVTNKSTPIVFVTGVSEFENRSRSTLNGGTEWIAKPFLLAELAVKALTLIVRALLAPKSVNPSLPLQDVQRRRTA